MSVTYQQGETIAFFVEGKHDSGALASLADLAGITITGQMQKTVGRNPPEPDPTAPLVAFAGADVEATAETGAGRALTCTAAQTLNLDPGLYIFESTVEELDGTKSKEQVQVNIKAGVK